MQIGALARVDSREISDDQAEIRAFMNIRDEMLRLPHTLDHYRRIGVARFFITDNGSVDGSREFVLNQPDCHLFITSESYAFANYGLKWQQELLDRFGVNRWCLTVDTDEWFVYPGYETRALSDLASYLDQTGAQGVLSFLLDMYGARALADTSHAPGHSLLETCHHFDREYRWRRRFHIPGFQLPRFPEYTIVGGPRLRLFFPSFKRYEILLRILWRISEVTRCRIPISLRPAPSLIKIPFLRWMPGTRYQTPHATTPIPLSRVTGVLLHFKFLEDFYARVVAEADRKEHFDDASEYRRYLQKLRDHPSLSFLYNGSLAYKGSEQLVRLGLLREDQEWKNRRAASISDRASGKACD